MMIRETISEVRNGIQTARLEPQYFEHAIEHTELDKYFMRLRNQLRDLQDAPRSERGSDAWKLKLAGIEKQVEGFEICRRVAAKAGTELRDFPSVTGKITPPVQVRGKAAIQYDFPAIASDFSLDLHGTRISPEGIQLDLYRRSPRLIFGHDAYGGFMTPDPRNVIGTTSDWFVKQPEREFRLTLHVDDGNDYSRDIARKLSAGILTDLSIGMIPLEVKSVTEGDREVAHLEKVMLLEVSVVPIGSNTNSKILRD